MADASDATSAATVLTVAGTVAVSIITGIVTVWVGRRKEKTDVQSTINSGFTLLITEMQEERDALKKTVEAQGKELERMRGELRQAMQRIESLERFISRAGLTPPEISG